MELTASMACLLVLVLPWLLLDADQRRRSFYEKRSGSIDTIVFLNRMPMSIPYIC